MDHELIPLFAILMVFGSFAAVIIVPIWLRSRERIRMQDTVRAAIERGQALPNDVIEAMTRNAKPVPSRTRDIRRAVIWLAIAGAVATWGLLEQLNHGWWASPSDWFGLAAIPGFIGLAFLVLGLLNKRD